MRRFFCANKETTANLSGVFFYTQIRRHTHFSQKSREQCKAEQYAENIKRLWPLGSKWLEAKEDAERKGINNFDNLLYEMQIAANPLIYPSLADFRSTLNKVPPEHRLIFMRMISHDARYQSLVFKLVYNLNSLLELFESSERLSIISDWKNESILHTWLTLKLRQWSLDCEFNALMRKRDPAYRLDDESEFNISLTSSLTSILICLPADDRCKALMLKDNEGKTVAEYIPRQVLNNLISEFNELRELDNIEIANSPACAQNN